jgi:hypothetical protein
MGASISSDATVGMATMVLAVAILLWGAFRVMWRSEPHANSLPDRHGTQVRYATAPVPIPVQIQPVAVRRRKRLE